VVERLRWSVAAWQYGLAGPLARLLRCGPAASLGPHFWTFKGAVPTAPREPRWQTTKMNPGGTVATRHDLAGWYASLPRPLSSTPTRTVAQAGYQAFQFADAGHQPLRLGGMLEKDGVAEAHPSALSSLKYTAFMSHPLAAGNPVRTPASVLKWSGWSPSLGRSPHARRRPEEAR